MVEVLEPVLAVIVPGAAATEDCAADTAAGSTVTAAVCVMATLLIVAEIVLSWATVDRNVAVATPLPSVVSGPEGEKKFCVPVEASETLAPPIGFPDPSRAVTVMSEAVPPPVVHGGELSHAVMGVCDAATVDCDADTDPIVMSKPALVAGVSPVAVACRV